MKAEPKASFTQPVAAVPRLSMMAAVKSAREALSGITSQGVDSVGRCERRSDGGWIVELDVIESPARMGDNDFLATYAIDIDAEGEPLQINRTRRYHREDKNQA